MGDNNFTEDILDFLGFLVLLGVCIAVAIGIVVPAMHSSFMTEDKAIVDKTAPLQEGFDNQTNFDGAMSKVEVALMMRVQDFGIPEPNRFKVRDGLYEVRSSYEANEELYAEEVFKTLHTSDPGNNLRYRWEYNYGAPPSDMDLDTGNLVLNPKAESYDSNLFPTGWNSYTTSYTDVDFTVRRSDQWVISGSSTFEIRTTPNPNGTGLDYTGYYYQNIDLEPSKKYRFTATLSCHRCEGYISAEVYDTAGNVITYDSPRVLNTGTPTKREIQFYAPVNASHVRLKLVKDISRGSQANLKDHLFVDDVSLQILDGEDPHYYLVSK